MSDTSGVVEMVTIRNEDGTEIPWPKAGVRFITGWTVVDGSTAPYDPAEHNVDDVLEHLRGLDDEAEIARIAAAEDAGERKSVQVAAWMTKRAAEGSEFPTSTPAAPAPRTPGVDVA